MCVNVGDGELGPTSLAGTTEEAHEKRCNSRFSPEEPGVGLPGAGAGASALCPLCPAAQNVAGDWREELMSGSELELARS